jgi:EmrB/QacA subfamily drug resistance transporter
LNARGNSGRGTARHPNWTLVTSVLASSLSFVDGSVLNVALPAIRTGYHAGAADVQWVVNAYLLPLSALLLLGGALGDVYGRRLWLVIGTALFGAASLVCALAPSLNVLLAARALQGTGAALLLPNSLAILNASFEGEARGRAIGIWAAASAMAAAVAPVIGGWLVDTVGWPAIFYINLPLAAGAILLAFIFVAESRNESAGRTDYAGAALVTAGLGGMTYALTRWSSSAKFDVIAAVAVAAGAISLAAFIGVERRGRDKAMIPLAIFADRCFAGLNLMTFLLYGAFGASMLLIPYVLISSAGYSPVQAGLALGPISLVLACASPAMGALAIRIGPRLPLTIGPLVVGGGLLLGLRIDIDASYWAAVLPSVLVLACGMAIAVAPLTASVLGAVKPEHTGMASGFNSAVARAGGLIATALLGAVLRQNGEALIGGFHEALIVSTLVCAASSATALTMLGGARMKRQP